MNKEEESENDHKGQKKDHPVLLEMKSITMEMKNQWEVIMKV